MSRASLPGSPGTASSSSRLARHEAIGRAEVLEQGALADRADAAQLVEQRRGHRLVAPRRGGGRSRSGAPRRAPAAAGEAPRSRTGSAAARSGRGRRPPRSASRARSTAVPRSTSGAERAHARRELALAAVDQDQVRAATRSSRRARGRAASGRPARAAARDAPRQHLLHRGEVVGPGAHAARRGCWNRR